MLKLIRMYGVNGCQHAEFDLDLSGGVIGILGTSGIGKSNLTYALLQFALTGMCWDAAGNSLPRSELLRRGFDSGFVALEFVHDDVEHVVRWELGKDAQSLKFGTTTISKANDVRAHLEKIYGAPCKSILSTNFMRQDGAKEFLWMTPAERQDDLKAMFEALDTDKVMSDLQTVINEIGVPVDRSAEMVKCQEDLKNGVDAVDSFVRDLEGKHQRLNDSRALYETALGRMQLTVVGNMELVLSAQQQAINKAAQDLYEHEAKRPDAGAEPAKPDPEGQRKQTVMEQYKRERSRYDSLEERLTSARATLAAVPAAIDLKTIEAGKVQLNGQKHSAEFELSGVRFKNSEMKVTKDLYDTGGTCPITKKTCPVVPDEEARKAFEVEYAKSVELVKQKERDLQRAIGEIDKCDRHLKEITKKNADNDATRRVQAQAITSIEADMDALNGTLQKMWNELGDFDINVYLASVNTHVAWQKVVKAVSDHDNRTLALRKQLDALKNKLIDMQRPQEGITQKEYDEAKATANLFRTLETDTKVAENSLANARTRVATIEERIKFIQEADADGIVNQKVRKDLDTLRLFFHRNNGPGYVTRANLARYNEALRKQLDTLNFGIRAWVSNDFKFLYDHPDSGVYAMPAVRLSGGQGMGVAICEKLARMSVTECRIPLLVLDEPAGPLSADKIKDMVALFDKLRIAVAGRWTILVPSHAAALESSFDRVIRIGP